MPTAGSRQSSAVQSTWAGAHQTDSTASEPQPKLSQIWGVFAPTLRATIHPADLPVDPRRKACVTVPGGRAAGPLAIPAAPSPDPCRPCSRGRSTGGGRGQRPSRASQVIHSTATRSLTSVPPSTALCRTARQTTPGIPCASEPPASLGACGRV